jgi:hypothetical protein
VTAHLVVFDRDPGKPWSEKISRREETRAALRAVPASKVAALSVQDDERAVEAPRAFSLKRHLSGFHQKERRS